MAGRRITATAAVFVLVATTIVWSAFSRSSDGSPGPRRWTQAINTASKGDRLVSPEQGAPMILVHHFGAKPQAQQAKVKTRDGVKVISEE